MSKYHNDASLASDPVDISLDQARLGEFKAELGLIQRYFRCREIPDDQIDEHLSVGDSRAAVAIDCHGETLVAAYTDEIDCVCLLRFPKSVLADRRVIPGTRLLTVNTYSTGTLVVVELEEGPHSSGQFANFYPLIAEMFSDDLNTIERRKLEISEAEWQCAQAMAESLIAKDSYYVRDGSPYYSMGLLQPKPYTPRWRR